MNEGGHMNTFGSCISVREIREIKFFLMNGAYLLEKLMIPITETATMF